MGVSKNRDTPKWMVKIMENLIKMDDLGEKPLFLETLIYKQPSKNTWHDIPLFSWSKNTWVNWFQTAPLDGWNFAGGKLWLVVELQLKVPSGKLTWQWQITIFNGKYIFKGSIFHCYVGLPECNYLVGGWTNPFEKYARQIGSSPKVRSKIKNIWSFTT